MSGTALTIQDAEPETSPAVQTDGDHLIALAINKGVDVETLERLLVMRDKLRAERARDEYFRSLAMFQSQIPPIHKSRKVKDKNGKHRYSYAPMEEIVAVIREPLMNNGFSYRIEPEQTKETVAARCIVHHVGGHSESTRFEVPIDPEAYMNAAQKVASALTYSKRYALCDALGIVTADEDDDAQATERETAAGQDRRPAPAAKPDKIDKPAGDGSAQSLYTECVNAIKTLKDPKAKGGAFSLISKHSQDAEYLTRALESLKAGKAPSE